MQRISDQIRRRFRRIEGSVVKARILLCWVLIAVALLSACAAPDNTSTQTTGMQSTSTAPRIAVPAPPTSSQVNMGRAAVNRDPCRELGDDVVAAAGFDPATRDRIDAIFDTYSFVGCKFEHKEKDQFGLFVTTRYLHVNTTNVTMDEFRDREASRATPIEINGIEAITYMDRPTESCHIILETSYGALDISKSVASVFTVEKPCDRMPEIAEMVSAAMPD